MRISQGGINNMGDVTNIRNFDQLVSFINDNDVNIINTMAEKEFDLELEYKNHINKTIETMKIKKFKFISVVLLRRIRPLALIYYKVRGVTLKQELFDKRPFYAEFVVRLLPAPFLKNTMTNPTTRDAIKEIKNNINRYCWLSDNLEDELSKRVLFNILMFRITKKLEYINDIQDCRYQ